MIALTAALVWLATTTAAFLRRRPGGARTYSGLTGAAPWLSPREMRGTRCGLTAGARFPYWRSQVSAAVCV
jgi:hypothetical protein